MRNPRQSLHACRKCAALAAFRSCGPSSTRTGLALTPLYEHGPRTEVFAAVIERQDDLAERPQTGEYSTKIFSLSVLLSSLFVYNQMGGIDEASLDRLSLVTEVRCVACR